MLYSESSDDKAVIGTLVYGTVLLKVTFTRKTNSLPGGQYKSVGD